MAFTYNELNQKAYDPIGQLLAANDSSGNAYYSRGYVYDAAWNLNWRTNGTSGTDDFTVDTKNQLSSYTWSSGSETFTYDPSGNLTQRVTLAQVEFTYSYDDENRLTFMEYDDFGTPYYQLNQAVYDGVGRLRAVAEYIWDGTQWNLNDAKEYIYDGWRVVQERDGSNNPTVSYTRGNDLSGSLEGAGGIGGLLARSCGYSSGNWTTNDYYFADGNGNITYMTDGNQAMVAQYRYDPYGNELSVSGSLAQDNSYRFSSKEMIAKPLELYGALYYYGYRFYDPFLQRWINRDPWGELGFEAIHGFQHEPQSGDSNLYSYLANDPVNFLDYVGLERGRPLPKPTPFYFDVVWGKDPSGCLHVCTVTGPAPGKKPDPALLKFCVGVVKARYRKTAATGGDTDAVCKALDECYQSHATVW